MRLPFQSSASRDFPVTAKALVPWIVCGIFVVYLAASALPVLSGNGFDVTAFGRLPVLANGRVQPFDSVARTTLLQIRGPVTPLIDGLKAPPARPAMIDPTVWLLEVLAKPDTADTRRIFPIKSRELLGKLQLAPGRGTNYYAFNDLGAKSSEIQKQHAQIPNTKASDRAQWQEELIALREKLMLYERLKNSLAPNSRLQQDAKGKPVTFDFAGELAKYQVDLAEALRVDVGRRSGSAERLDVPTEMRIRTFSALFQFVSRMGVLSMVPRSNTPGSSKDWSNIGSLLVKSAQGHQPPPAVRAGQGGRLQFSTGPISSVARGQRSRSGTEKGPLRGFLQPAPAARQGSRPLCGRVAPAGRRVEHTLGDGIQVRPDDGPARINAARHGPRVRHDTGWNAFLDRVPGLDNRADGGADGPRRRKIPAQWLRNLGKRSDRPCIARRGIRRHAGRRSEPVAESPGDQPGGRDRGDSLRACRRS
jgi:hypothetical protein